MGQRTGVQLDTGGARLSRRFDLHRVGANEQGHPAARCSQACASALNAFELTGDVQAALGGDFLATLWHQANMLGGGTLDDVEHLVGNRCLEIQGHGNGLFETHDIFIADVTAVFAQVEGDDVGPALHSQERSRHRVRKTPATRVAQSGDVVDVHAQQGGVQSGQLGAGEGHDC